MAKGLPSRDVIRQLEADGWRLKRVKGDHHHYHHPDKKGLVTVAHPTKDIPTGTLRNIERQCGFKFE